MDCTRFIGFCLVLLCMLSSCRSKKLDSSIDAYENYAASHESNVMSVLKDTSRTLRVFVDKSSLRIVETLKITEYDKESGKPVKETDAKREIAQDSDKVDSKEETGGVNVHSQGSQNHFADASKKINTETKEEFVGGQEAFGKWLGIILGLAAVAMFLYIAMKIKSVIRKK